MERNDSYDLVAALRSQIVANKERLRRTRKMVAVINQHLDDAEEARRIKEGSAQS